MRDSFKNDLDAITRQTADALMIARDALEQTVEALIDRDDELANAVIAGDDKLDAIYQSIHTEMLGTIARQAPVAGDLRLLTGLGFMAVHIERMGDGCVNIAKLLKLAGPESHSAEMTARVAAMGKDLIAMLDQAARAFEERNIELAVDLVDKDDAVDDANLRVFQLACSDEIPAGMREWAGFMMLIGRALERIGDHIVDLGEQIAFIVTGEFREFTDASHEDSLERAARTISEPS